MKYKVMIIEKEKEDDDKISYLVKLNNDKFILNIYTKNKYDSAKDFDEGKINQISKYIYGDSINISGKIAIPELLRNIGEFNYKRYLNSKDICGLINAYDVKYVENSGSKLIKFIYDVKNNISKSIDNNLSGKEAGLLKAMIYGEKIDLDDEIKNQFNEISTSHITAVSGSNISILLMFLSIIFCKIKNNKKIYLFIQLLVISFFCILSSLELSVIRATIMSYIMLISRYKNIKLSTEKILLITIYIMTLINPFRIYNIGLMYSFFAIIGLVFFSKRISNYLESKIKWNIKNKILIKILLSLSNIFAITISVNILVLPLSIYTFNKVSLIFVLSNLIISSVASLINILGVISIVLTKIPIISTFCYFILEKCLKLVIFLSDFFSNINYTVKIKSFPIYILIIYYLYILVVCIKFKSNRKYMKNILDKIKRKIIYVLLITIVLVCIYNSFLNNYIYFFNVGQGEMAVIKNNKTVVMVDSGSITNDTAYIFESYVNKENIQKIDILVISHFHSDHINGILEIAKICDINYLIYAYPYDFTSKEYIKTIQGLEKENIKHIIAKAGDNISINGLNINILSPEIKYLKLSDKLDENENVNSLVFNISVNNKNYLFMGDTTKEAEEKIIENLKKQNIKEIEILKVGHHGSKTSTSEKFIQSILPNYSVISCKNRVYNHPSKETINTLNKYRVKTYITEKVGGIKYNI